MQLRNLDHATFSFRKKELLCDSHSDFLLGVVHLFHMFPLLLYIFFSALVTFLCHVEHTGMESQISVQGQKSGRVRSWSSALSELGTATTHSVMSFPLLLVQKQK